MTPLRQRVARLEKGRVTRPLLIWVPPGAAEPDPATIPVNPGQELIFVTWLEPTE